MAASDQCKIFCFSSGYVNFRKMGLQLILFPFHPQLFEIKSQSRKVAFRFHIHLFFRDKSAEAKVIFEKAKGAFHLD